MAPKTVKKQASKADNTESNIATLKAEWISNIKEIMTLRTKLSALDKLNDEIVAKLWDIMKENPTNDIIIDGEPEEPVPVKETKEDEKPKSTKKKVEESADKEEKTVKPKTTKKKIEKVEEKPTEEKPTEEKPITVKKTTKKAVPKEEEPVAPKAKPAGKISAPSKGTPKPKTVVEEEKPKTLIEDSSSDETDLDSLSSVSDESDISGGEDD